MVARLIDTLLAIEGEKIRRLTWVVVEEVKGGDRDIGGQALTTADGEALAAAQPRLVR